MWNTGFMRIFLSVAIINSYFVLRKTKVDLVLMGTFGFQEALKVMEFTEEEIRDVFKLLSAVLQMGNIEFMTAGGAQITSKGGRLKAEPETQTRSAPFSVRPIKALKAFF